MVFINLFFVIVNGWFMLYFLEDEPSHWLGWLNALACVLNLIPVVGALL